MLTIVRKTITRQFGDTTITDAIECRSKGAIRVKCRDCGWTGYRRPLQCECYEDWAGYCRPWSPGPGCPSGILYDCPRCRASKKPARKYRFPGDVMSAPHDEPQL